jgi:hypothetical protein
MIKANATTEQRIKGQMGQPAACMIENKHVSFRGETGSNFWAGRIMGPVAHAPTQPQKDLFL